MKNNEIIETVKTRFNENLVHTSLTPQEISFFLDLAEWAVLYTIAL